MRRSVAAVLVGFYGVVLCGLGLIGFLSEMQPALLGNDVVGDHRPRLLVAVAAGLLGVVPGSIVVWAAAAVGSGRFRRVTALVIVSVVTTIVALVFGWSRAEHRRCSLERGDEVCVSWPMAFAGAGLFAAAPGLIALASLATVTVDDPPEVGTPRRTD